MKIIKIVIVLILIFLFSSYFYTDKSSLAFAHIVTFFSIIIGFCITSLSIISTSKFSKKLYSLESSEDNSKTLLHELLDKFEKCIIYASIVIFSILIFYYLSDFKFGKIIFYKTHLSFSKLINGIIWTFTLVTIIYFFKLIKMFKKFVVQSAKFL